MTSDLSDLALSALAVQRATRLVTTDDITAALRDKWIEAAYTGAGRHGYASHHLPHDHEGKWADYARADPDVPKWAQLSVCPFCVSVWATLAACALATFTPRLWARLRWVGAVAGAVAVFHDIMEK